jgi:membrane associated rhomboid family serine protease
MFFILPWRLRQLRPFKGTPVANIVLILVNVLFYLLGWRWFVGPGTGPLSIVFYAFSHIGLWHVFFNMWALWIFGNALNRRLGNGYYLLAYLGAVLALGLFARLVLPEGLVGASGVVFTVITMALVLMPAGVLEIACLALFPLSAVIGLVSRPRKWSQWLIRWAVYPIPALWALLLIPLLELFAFFWNSWSLTNFAHLLGMLLGLVVLVLLPTTLTMGRRSFAGSR